MTRRTLPTLAYDAITIEGGLFNAEWLAKVAHLDAPLQQPDDYAIPDGLNLRDEIARAWRMAQAQWLKFQPTLATPTAAAAERFVTALLQGFGFDALQKLSGPLVLGERSFPINHAQGHIPVLIAAPSEGLDEGYARFGEPGRRRSPFGLLQEYLNAADTALWGLVSNGLKLRLLRDNASLTRPAWLEADLERIFTEERFADFSALWLTLHASRFGRPDADPADCALEAWRQAGQQAGIRARDELRRGVERALTELGQGFLAEPANADLRAALIEGRLTPAAYFQQLLRLVYRLIFLLTVEERGLLHPPASDPAAQKLYERGYGLRRLRERAVRHSAHDAHTDLYAALKITFRALATGEPRLALPALGGLFGSEQTPWLDAAQLQNRHLLSALWALAWIARDGATERVNWHDMGPEELGSVYESLLELVPVVDAGATRFRFAGGDETRGNARKLSGSYYTPDSLVQALLDSALEPVIAQKKAERPDDEAAAILSITVIDPGARPRPTPAGRRRAPPRAARGGLQLPVRRGPQPHGAGTGQDRPVAGSDDPRSPAVVSGPTPGAGRRPARRARSGQPRPRHPGRRLQAAHRRRQTHLRAAQKAQPRGAQAVAAADRAEPAIQHRLCPRHPRHQARRARRSARRHAGTNRRQARRV